MNCYFAKKRAPTAAIDTMAALKANWSHGEALWREREADQASNAFLVSFSRGKDSIAVFLALMRAGSELVPFYCERVPGLSFVEESLDYYEPHLFGRHIIRALHPSTANQLRTGMFQPPHWLATNRALGIGPYDYVDIQTLVAFKEGLSKETWTATGVRGADSQMRRKSIAINRPKSVRKRTVATIWDWKLDRVVGTIAASGLKLPADYQLFGRTFNGLRGEFVGPFKKQFSTDSAKVCELFLLIDVQVMLYQRAHG